MLTLGFTLGFLLILVLLNAVTPQGAKEEPPRNALGSTRYLWNGTRWEHQ